jgi:hypothetical protein
MLHCVRLIDVAVEMLETCKMTVYRPNNEYLKSIRLGKLTLSEILESSKEKIEQLNILVKTS